MEIAGIAILGAVLIAAIAAPGPSFKVHRGLLAVLGRLARGNWTAPLICAACSVAASVAYALIVRWPEPSIHDEFSYLLAADTFRHGRLTNPTHPMWGFFETFSVIHLPSYASKYFPAQGLLLAAGWWLCGHPIAGVWAGGALMSAAMWWMLRGFLPARWALAGGLIAASQLGATGEWTQGYFGGCIAATGGALLVGALPRLWHRDRLRDSAAIGLGLALLASSRPFEGAVVALPAAFVFVGIAVRRARMAGARSLVRLVAPAAVVLAASGTWMAYYNFVVTGDPLRLPYMEHETQYAVAPSMLWLPLRPVPAYRTEELGRFWSEAMVEPYLRLRTFPGFMQSVVIRSEFYWRFYVGPVLTLALLGVPFLLRRWWIRFAIASLLLLALALLGETFALHHYASPGAGLIILLVTAGLRSLAHVTVRGWRLGAAVVFFVLVVFLLKPALKIGTTAHVGPKPRSQISSQLVNSGSRHLVIVRYGPDRSLHTGWVFNAADIDASPVVWAHDFGAEQNRPLLDYFGDRTAWLLEVGFGQSVPRLVPYSR